MSENKNKEYVTCSEEYGNIHISEEVLAGIAAAAALEAIRVENIIGTLAGDDTLLVLFANEQLARAFCRDMNVLYIKE